jgi:hypothetical protein
MEFFVAILPIPVIFDLRMEKRQRWSVISLLSLGFLVTIVGCVRCYFVWKGMLETYDITWWSEQHWICSEVENDVALVCILSVVACLSGGVHVSGTILISTLFRCAHAHQLCVLLLGVSSAAALILVLTGWI